MLEEGSRRRVKGVGLIGGGGNSCMNGLVRLWGDESEERIFWDARQSPVRNWNAMARHQHTLLI